jgi:hypothetical protein
MDHVPNEAVGLKLLIKTLIPVKVKLFVKMVIGMLKLNVLFLVLGINQQHLQVVNGLVIVNIEVVGYYQQIEKIIHVPVLLNRKVVIGQLQVVVVQ